MKRPLIERLLPVPARSGFRLDGYFVWCPTLIRVDGRYHLFASRWPNVGDTGQSDLSGYRSASEIVRAVADTPTGPFELVDVVLAGRGPGFWDGQMCHNPKICVVDDKFVLYYIGSSSPTGVRQIGYAVATSIDGPWTRLDEPISLTPDANNPAPLVMDDESVLLAFRDDRLRMHVARAASFDSPYTVIAHDIYPAGPLEDPDLFIVDGMFHMAVEDNVGRLTGDIRHGGHLVSRDGVAWHEGRPAKLYTHTVGFDDGSVSVFDRRERPELFSNGATIKGHGEPTHLLTGVKLGTESWCLVQPIAVE